MVLAPLGGVGVVLVAPFAGGLGAAGPLLALFSAALLTLLGGLAFARGYAASAGGVRSPRGGTGASGVRCCAQRLVFAAFAPAVSLANGPGPSCCGRLR